MRFGFTMCVRVRAPNNNGAANTYLPIEKKAAVTSKATQTNHQKQILFVPIFYSLFLAIECF